MWKLWNKLFGWDYIYWQNSCTQGIARIFVDAEGNPVYFRYKITKLIDKIPHPKTQTATWQSHVIWLTCTPSKYFKE